MKRFYTGKDEIDFTKLSKLTRQKHWSEKPEESVRHRQRALQLSQVCRLAQSVEHRSDARMWFESNIGKKGQLKINSFQKGRKTMEDSYYYFKLTNFPSQTLMESGRTVNPILLQTNRFDSYWRDSTKKFFSCMV